MSNEMDFEIELKKSFNEEAPELPDGLKKENVIAMLEKDKLQPKKKKKHIFPKILATAAALIIVIAAATVVPLMLPDKPLIDATTTEPVSDESSGEIATTAPHKQESYEVIDNGLKAAKLKQAQSNDELQKHFLKLYRENRIDDFFDGIYGVAEDMADSIVFNTGADGAMAENAMPGATQAMTSQAVAQNSDDKLVGYGDKAESYGQTNVQVENVDEADIIKNDGKYLYILSSGMYNGKTAVNIVDAKDMKVASKIEINEEDYYHNIQEMYVYGDRLVLVANENEKAEPRDEDSKVAYDVAYPYYYGKAEKIVSFVYNISDREKPVFVRKVSQDGARYISSRMIDGVLYSLSSYVVRGDSEDEVKANAVPEVNGAHIACDCIYVYDYDSNSYLVLSAYDTKLDNGEVNSLSILGSGDNVYCSRDALYVARTNYDNVEGSYSDIYAFSLDGTKIAYKASGTVKGNFLNQFSFDEYEGNLRVATTYYSYKHDVDVSSVYVLNKNLELIGALEDIAYDEQVKSVRFMGDAGYIVTFRNTDPLFTLDLSDPTAPKVIGEVKLPGFSSYLHPVGDGLVVGLGYDGDEENADFNTVKVSLFDVSDLKNPKEVDTFVLKDVTSSALYNHKAFIYYPEENLIGFPVEHYGDYRNTVFSYKLLKIENRVIESHLGYTHKTERGIGTIFRGTYIGDKLYTVDSYRVCEFDIDTAALLRECEILALEDDKPDKNIYGEAVTTPAVMPGGVVEITVPPTSPEEDINGKVDTTVGLTGGNAVDSTTTTAPAPVVSPTTTGAPKGVYYFDALVIKVNEGSVLVEATAQGDSGITVGTQVTFGVNDEYESYEAGDKVRVSYDGYASETYPLHISNVFGIERLG